MALNQFFKPKGFAVSTGKLAVAGIVGQAIMLAVMPLVARLYSPDDFGVFAVFAAVFTVILSVSSLRYELAIPLPRGRGNALSALRLALLLNAVACIICALVVLPFGNFLSRALGVPELIGVLWLLPLSVLGAGSYRAFRFWALRCHDFDGIARTKITQSIANATFQLLGGLAGLGVVGLAVGHLLGFTAGTYRLTKDVRPYICMTAGGWQIARMRSLASRYSRFPKFDVAAALLNGLSVQLPNLLLAVLFNPVVAGYYLLADRVLAAPLSLLSQSIGQVLYARSRQAIESDGIATLCLKVLAGLALIVAAPSLVIFLFAAPIFAFVFGAEWAQAGVYAGWLMLGLAAQLLYSSISLILMATNGQKLNLAIHLCLLLGKLFALGYGLWMSSAYVAIIALAITNTVGYLAASAVVVAHTHSYERTLRGRPRSTTR